MTGFKRDEQIRKLNPENLDVKANRCTPYSFHQMPGRTPEGSKLPAESP